MDVMRACATPGCRRAAPIRQRRCNTCAKREEQERAASRGGACRFYAGAFWQRLRRVVLTAEPLCQICERAAAREVDHKDGDATNNLRENLQALCKPCHSKKTAEHDGSFGR